ncbi:MAG: hypothetical protein EKK63_11175 [Acinetobacter sp.]|uniref:AbrB/MazE/SpoVT family DNA-binding domain-containing protein n=1 Tax=Acinetobacter sp. TaxID=472 RepID=UPI000F92177B|nr:AbrB/MazE/SpoVT family DNA-binding domain-containing protein [Acinetobacter sp.]RUP38922.1 MAG: hypothetical protein EKK63_11175 [Acinetobacter sp.]
MKTQIEQLVSQLTGNATMFTGFDITMMLRRANPTTNIRHGEVRDIVHQLYTDNAMTGYIRTIQRMDNNQEAFVHHPYGTDAEDYDPNFLAHSTPQSLSAPNLSVVPTQAVANQATVTTPTNSAIGNSLANKPKRARYAIDSVPKDKFGRIRVPASVLRAAGFGPKDTVRVVLDPNIIIVTAGNDAYGYMNGKKYVVDEYNNVRVHLKGKFPANTFKMVPNQSKVYITPV